MSAPRRLVVLGATGSVGRSALDVAARNPDRFSIEVVAGGRDAEALARTARESGARLAVIADADRYPALKQALSGSGIAVAAGDEAVVEAALRPCDLVVAAITGVAGLRSTHAAACQGGMLAIANKESLVCAGPVVMAAAARAGTTILPMDSEHNALFQAIEHKDRGTLDQLLLTASGGPFRTWPAARIAAATRAEALAHPKWSMGAKISIDSATLMNKGLELIEAQHLFGLAPQQLGVLIHPESIVHGLARFRDGAVLAGLAVHDMRVPIAHCLGYPERIDSGAAPLDLAAIASLHFEKPDTDRFPALGLAMAAMRAGGAQPAILNAANEVAVAAFLAGEIGFGHIAALVEETLEAAARTGLDGTPADIDEALAVDHVSRNLARERLATARSLAPLGEQCHR